MSKMMDFHGVQLVDAEQKWWNMHSAAALGGERYHELCVGHGVIRARFMELSKQHGVECRPKLGNAGILIVVFGGN